MGTYYLDYYEQQRMRKLLENIIKDYEENNSLVTKKNNIRKLANEFTKEETIRVNQLKAKG